MAFFTQTRVGVRSRSSLTGSWEMESKDASLTVEGLSRRLLKCYLHLSLIPFLSLFRLAPSAERSRVVLGVRGLCTDLTALTNISGLWVWALRSTCAFPSHQVSCFSRRSVCIWVCRCFQQSRLETDDGSFCHSRYASFFLSSALQISSLFLSNAS